MHFYTITKPFQTGSLSRKLKEKLLYAEKITYLNHKYFKASYSALPHSVKAIHIGLPAYQGEELGKLDIYCYF